MEELNKIADGLYVSLSKIQTSGRSSATGLVECYFYIDQIKQWINNNTKVQSGDEHDVG